MHELERIELALESKRINHELFERFAQDALSELFPGLVPIPGGTDWGRDADIIVPDEEIPYRLLVTSARSLDGVRNNLRRGVQSMIDKGLQFDQLVLCNLAQLSQLDRVKLQETAARKGARLAFIFDRLYVASRLRLDGQWRSNLLGLSPDPITLGRSPVSLTESPWASLPLVGREGDLAQIESAEGDVILTGPPGVGKSRLLAEIDEAMFVDSGAATGRLAEDIRFFQPGVLAIDDAGASEGLVRFLTRLRVVEPELARYRLIAVCWPEEVTAIEAILPNADRVKLDLLERENVDQIIRSMGVTGALARSEILAQAEGRPGWAVALADLLVSSKEATSLLSGRALLDEVEAFVRRTRAGSDTMTLLTVIAALGGVEKSDFPSLQSELGLNRSQLIELLRRSATSGLIDLSTHYEFGSGQEICRYNVRPPMLARALVADQVFISDVPALDLVDIATRFPASQVELATSASYSALLGADNARPVADSLFRSVMERSDISGEGKLALCETFAAIDPAAGHKVLEFISRALPETYRAEEPNYWLADQLVDIARLIAGRHASEEAVEILLDAALADGRSPRQHTSHPTRALQDLVHSFHPELPSTEPYRRLIADTLASWLIPEQATSAQWRVFGEQAANLLSFSMSSVYAPPENPRSVQLIETVVGPEEMNNIYEEVWPGILAHLRYAPVEAVAEVVDTATDWLRIGAGFDRPFGGSHPSDSISSAAELGEQLIDDLVPLVTHHPGLATRLKRAGEPLGIKFRSSTSHPNESFFLDVERGTDLREEVSRLEEAIAATVSQWQLNDPSPVLSTLGEIKKELHVAQMTWPDRIQIAFAAIAESLNSRSTWIRASLDASLFPHAAPLLAASVEKREELSLELWLECFSDPGARWTALSLALQNPPSDRVYRTTLDELAPSDFTLIESKIIRSELSDRTLKDLLTLPRPTTRAAVAAGMFVNSQFDPLWTPSDLETEWIDAVVDLDFNETRGFSGHQVGDLFDWLAANQPDTLVELMLRSLDDDAIRYGSMPSDGWGKLHKLSHRHKSELWSTLSARPGLWLLRQYLVGEDSAWLETMLDQGHFNIEDALASYSAFGPHPTIEDLAKILIPRGVDPERIATLARAGSWTGELSDRYRSLAERFGEMAKSNDVSVARVGEAGQEMFVRAQEAALEEERMKRVRGDL